MFVSATSRDLVDHPWCFFHDPSLTCIIYRQISFLFHCYKLVNPPPPTRKLYSCGYCNRLPYNLYCVGGDVKHCSIRPCGYCKALDVALMFDGRNKFTSQTCHMTHVMI